MPFLSLLTNSATNFGLTGNALEGTTARSVYKFVPSPFGPSGLYNPMPDVPSNIKETNEGFNDQTFVFYVNGTNTNGRPLYWKIKHITTSEADFQATSGFFGSNNWGISAYNPGYSWYNNPYGDELGRFGIEVTADNTQEGNETFQIEIREHPTLQPVLTSSVITVNDTSAPIFAFDTSYSNWNFHLQNGFIEEVGYGGELHVTATNISIYTESYVYYTILPGPGVTNLDLITSSYDRYQQSLPTGTIYIYNDQYYENGQFKNHPHGWGKFFVSPRTDRVTEGPETFQIQLRSGSTSGPIIETSPVFTIKDVADPILPVGDYFEFQAIGGGAAGPISQAGGGGGAGQFFQGTTYAQQQAPTQTFKVFIGQGGIGRDTTTANNTILEGGILQNNSYYEQWIAYFGGWGATYGSNGAPSTAFGSTGGGCYTPATQFLPDGRWEPGTIGSYPSQTSNVFNGIIYANRGGPAWSSSYITSAGGGGGAGGVGSPGVSDNLAGTGGPGILDWTGAYVCYGGGGIAYAGGYPIDPTNTAYSPRTASTYAGGAVPSAVLETPHGLANTGGGGSWGGRGGSGKFILRYPSSNAALASATGEHTTYISGGYRYYVWTGNGTFRVQ